MSASSDELFLHATNLEGAGRVEEARGFYLQILAQEPEHFGSLVKLASLSAQRDENPALALQQIDIAIAAHPDNALGHISRGIFLLDLNRNVEALASFERAIALTPGDFYTHLFRGKTLATMGRHEDAVLAHNRSLGLNPTSAAFYCRAQSLVKLRRYEEAIADCDEAITRQPDYASAYVARGLAYDRLGRFQDAITSYDKALEFEPESGLAHRNRGTTLERLKRFPEAVVAYANAMQFTPDLPEITGDCMSLVMRLCDWQDYDQNLELIIAQIQADQLPCQPLVLLRLPVTAEQQQLLAAKHFHQITYGVLPVPLAFRPRSAKLRIGYFSADLGNHAVGNSLVGVFESHDKTRFETWGFLIDPRKEETVQTRIRGALDHFIDVSGKSDLEIVHMARELEIDIAIDLMGPTKGSRLAIYLMRLAPIQVNFFGYPGTMGTDAIDYIFADEIVIPPEDRRFYNEAVCYLPHSYQANDSKRPIPEVIPSRSDVGLPEDALVFCCFNQSSKLTPDAFESWMRILKAVPKSVLWIYVNDRFARENLQAEAASRGVPPERLIFAGALKLQEHLARQCLADLFLDTFHYGAHVTASDALWIGLPVLTRRGETFSSRVGASLLTALGLPDLIAETTDEYEQKAIALASEPGKITALKRQLQEKRFTSPLFDTVRFTRNLEAAYLAIADNYFAGRPPTDISISEPAAGTRERSPHGP